MAQYQHLPIYKQTYDILLRTMVATKELPREYKYTLGQNIEDELIELVVMIYRANSAADKAQLIARITAIISDWSMRPLVEALRGLRGMDLISAVTFVAAVGDLSRFENARQLMAYLGRPPREHAS